MFRRAIKAPVDRATTCKHLRRECFLATNLALSRDDWEYLQRAWSHGGKRRHFSSTVLAEMNGLFSPPVQYGGEVEGRFVFLALGTQHTLGG